ncbi:restriction endonuclease [Campylobacter suis]|uniref:Mrr restriction system protein n=1 Tax=Campylobacter suis TaxID=2790657 RepID=A0ABN7K9A6_9BACT|nr:restriction endonuclease [Campylobacter suis]CAD7289025.1 Mrr restriction system protein [Campylobacter suis]
MIPNFKEMMFPILEFLGKKGSANRQEIIGFVADFFKFSEEDKKEKTSNGTVTYVNRADWAVAYLANNKRILELPKSKILAKKTDGMRGRYEITESGKKLLSQKNAEQKFQNWYQDVYGAKISLSKNTANQDDEKTPIENILSISNELTQNLKSQILNEISSKNPRFFEFFVLLLLEKIGYGVGKLTKNGSDGGIDGIIDEDELGLSKVYIQAKNWQGSVSRPEIQKFVGAISDKATKKGIFITTSNFTKEAISYANGIQSHTISLIDGDRLSELAIKYKIGIQIRQNIEICDIDTDFFDNIV